MLSSYVKVSGHVERNITTHVLQSTRRNMIARNVICIVIGLIFTFGVAATLHDRSKLNQSKLHVTARRTTSSTTHVASAARSLIHRVPSLTSPSKVAQMVGKAFSAGGCTVKQLPISYPHSHLRGMFGLWMVLLAGAVSGALFRHRLTWSPFPAPVHSGSVAMMSATGASGILPFPLQLLRFVFVDCGSLREHVEA